MKPKRFLPFLFLRSKDLPRLGTRSRSPVLAFCLLLTPSCLLLLTSCKDIGIPPDRIIPDTTSHGPDTTSHNFIWTIDTLGDGSGGYLYGVAIINDTLAYAGGEIYLKDSSGQIDPIRYNLARWNGRSWNLSRLQFPQYNSDCTIAFYSPGFVRSVFAFTANSVLFTDGLSVIRWNGTTFISYPCVSLSLIGNGRFQNIWGVSESDFYCVGTGGTIFHFANSAWTKIESGVSDEAFRFSDIWGIAMGNGSELVLAVGSDFALEHRVIALVASSARDTLDWIFDKIPYSVWFSGNSGYYIAGDGLRKREKTWEVIDSTVFFHRVRGNAENDLFVFGGGLQTTLRHFNGSTWREYTELQIPFGFARDLAVKGSVAMAVGYADDVPYVIRGHRY